MPISPVANGNFIQSKWMKEGKRARDARRDKLKGWIRLEVLKGSMYCGAVDIRNTDVHRTGRKTKQRKEGGRAKKKKKTHRQVADLPL